MPPPTPLSPGEPTFLKTTRYTGTRGSNLMGDFPDPRNIWDFPRKLTLQCSLQGTDSFTCLKKRTSSDLTSTRHTTEYRDTATEELKKVGITFLTILMLLCNGKTV